MTIWWAIVFLAVFLIGVTKSGFGSGVGLMIVPMTAIGLAHIPMRAGGVRLGAEAALGLLLPLLVVGDFIAISQYFRLFFPSNRSPEDDDSFVPVSSGLRHNRQKAAAPFSPGNSTVAVAEPDAAVNVADAELPPYLRARLVMRRLLPGTFLGVILGGALLAVLHQSQNLVGALIRIEIGVESIILVGLHWWRIQRGVQQRLMTEPWRSHLTGGFAATSSTLAHAAGPIIAMYLLPLRLDRQLYVGTCAVYFFILNCCKLPAYYFSGQFAHAQLSFTLCFLPLVFAGAFFGKWLVKRLNDALFTKIVYVLTFLLGCYILFDGLRLLLWGNR
jgi:uncharacterized membrane protein YfcA